MFQNTLTLFLSYVLTAVAVHGSATTTTANHHRAIEATVYDLDGFTVKILGSGNVPKYTFASDEFPGSTYKVKFEQLYESKDGKRIGQTSLSLSSLEWVVETASSTVFWWNTTDEKVGHLAFRNELFNGTMKFDVILDNYNWESADSDALNLAWKMTNTSETIDDDDRRQLQEDVEGEPVTSSATKLCFYGSGGTDEGQVCFDIVDTATASVTNTDGSTTTTNVPVTLVYDSDPGIVITYARFQGNLTHDPRFGYATSASGEDSGFFGRLFALIRSFFASLLFFL